MTFPGKIYFRLLNFLLLPLPRIVEMNGRGGGVCIGQGLGSINSSAASAQGQSAASMLPHTPTLLLILYSPELLSKVLPEAHNKDIYFYLFSFSKDISNLGVLINIV